MSTALRELDPFGRVHTFIRRAVVDNKIGFEGKISGSYHDDLDPIIYKLFGLESEYTQNKDLLGVVSYFDKKVPMTDTEWIFSTHVMTILRAKCIKRGITELVFNDKQERCNSSVTILNEC